MAAKLYKVTGDTFNFKGKIKKADSDAKFVNGAWIVKLWPSDSLWRYEGALKFEEVSEVVDSSISAEKAYDNLNNEGHEGYNPHR